VFKSSVASCKFCSINTVSVQKRPFSDSALLHLQLLSFGANFCCPATTVAEFFSCTRGNSAPLLPQEQNVSHQTKVLLFCYHNCRMFLTREIFCSSATTIAECFSPEKYSALLLPQLQNVSHQRNTLLLCYHNCRMFLTREKFCSYAPTTECFLSDKYSAVLIPQQQNFP